MYVKDKNTNEVVISNVKADKSIRGQVGSPLSGLVTEIKCQIGDEVEKGQPLVVLSAMKMEMIVQSPVSGKIKSINVKKDMKIEGDDLIMEIDEKK